MTTIREALWTTFFQYPDLLILRLLPSAKPPYQGRLGTLIPPFHSTASVLTCSARTWHIKAVPDGKSSSLMVDGRSHIWTLIRAFCTIPYVRSSDYVPGLEVALRGTRPACRIPFESSSLRQPLMTASKSPKKWNIGHRDIQR